LTRGLRVRTIDARVFPLRRLYALPLPHNHVLHLGRRPLVMGILNVTPDSFGESSHLVAGGSVDVARAVDAALRMEAEGADIVDVGGESTRPGAEPVPPAEEASRVVPIIRALAARLRIPISVDTYKAGVARAAAAEGASIVNDISGLLYDPELARVVAETGVALVLMHTRGWSKTMYVEAEYGDVIAEVVAELRDRVACATRAGIPVDRLIVDPGIGFAKRPAHSYGVLAGLAELALALDRPVLVGTSRKSFLRGAVADRPAPERDWGTAAAVTAAVLAGAHVVRVHAVAEMVQVVCVAEEIRRHARDAAGPNTQEGQRE
jgi:dihydropteroate synthase